MSIALGLLIAVVCCGIPVYIVVREIRQHRRLQAMLAEYRQLTDELCQLQVQFVEKHSALSDEERQALWKPVADAVNLSLDQILPGLSGGAIGDPRPDMRKAVELARALVQK